MFLQQVNFERQQHAKDIELYWDEVLKECEMVILLLPVIEKTK